MTTKVRTRSRRDADRLKGLLAKDEVSQQQYDAAVAAAEAQTAATDTVKAQIAEAEAAKVPANAVAIHVQEVGANRPLVALNPERALNPASVMKLVTKPASIPPIIMGTTTRMMVRPREAPRFCAASSSDRCTCCKAAVHERSAYGRRRME